MDADEINQLRTFANKLALGAGKILLKYFHQVKVITSKSDQLDIATDADIASEKYIISQIRRIYPNHNIIAEETGDSKNKSDFTWIVDPLDGTKEFFRGLSIFNVSIAVEYKKQIICGSVFHPVSNELYSAAYQRGTKINSRPVHVSEVNTLTKALIGMHLPYYKTPDKEMNQAFRIIKNIVKNTYRPRPNSADVDSLCWVAIGGLDGFILPITGPKWWDVSPGLLMVEEAGGKVTNLFGNPLKDHNLSSGIIASNGILHEELLKIVKDSD